jgi:flagellar basal-body rod protein FlgB
MALIMALGRKEGRMGLFDKTTELVGRGALLGWLRHSLVASNLANAETPGFVPKDIDFAAELRKWIDGFRLLKTHPLHFGQGGFELVTLIERKGVANLDGNYVNLEEEVVKLSESYLNYLSLLRILQKKLDQLKYAIQEGGR